MQTADELDRQQKSRTARVSRMERIHATITAAPPTAEELHGATIFIDDAALPSDWHTVVAQHSGVVTQEPHRAMFIVARDPWAPCGANVHLTAVLIGSWVTTASVHGC